MQNPVSFQLASVCHPARNHTDLTVFIYGSEGTRSRFLPVNIQVSSLQATFGLLSLYSLSSDWVESLNECVNNLKFKSNFLFVFSYTFWLCSMCWICCRLTVNKCNQFSKALSGFCKAARQASEQLHFMLTNRCLTNSWKKKKIKIISSEESRNTVF